MLYLPVVKLKNGQIYLDDLNISDICPVKSFNLEGNADVDPNLGILDLKLYVRLLDDE